MRINVDVQSMTYQNFRGIPVYTRELLNQLLLRQKNDYSASFFDYRRERNNREKIISNIEQEYREQLVLNECNTMNFQTLMKNCQEGIEQILQYRYQDFFSWKADVYHYTNSSTIGAALPECSVVTVHDLIPLIYRGNGWFSSVAEERFLNSHLYLQQRTDVQLIADSEATKSDLINYLNIEEERITVVYPSYDEERMFPDEENTVLQKYGIDKPYILYIGALDPRKGINDLFEAFQYLGNRVRDYMLVLAGQGGKDYEKEIERMRNSSIADQIVFTGYISDDEKRQLFSHAEVFAFPSGYEGFGIPVLEAMACDCPVITTNISSLPEVGGEAAHYIPYHRTDLLAECLLEILTNNEIREQSIERGRKQREKFAWAQTAGLTEKVYNKFA